MPLLQKLLVSGFVPLIGQTLGALHKNSQNSLLLPFLYFSSNFFTNTILNPLGCLYIATSTPHTYTTLSRLRPSLKTLILVGPLRFLSTSSLLKPSTVPHLFTSTTPLRTLLANLISIVFCILSEPQLQALLALSGHRDPPHSWRSRAPTRLPYRFQGSTLGFRSSTLPPPASRHHSPL